jgi:hypothetical protein
MAVTARTAMPASAAMSIFMFFGTWENWSSMAPGQG